MDTMSETEGAEGLCVDDVQAQLAAIVESSEDAIVSMSLDGTILSWNAGAEAIFGYAPDEAIGQSILLIAPPELHDEERSILDRVTQGDRITHYETVRIAKSGQRLDISLTISPIRDQTGEIVAASKIARDITAHKRAVQSVQESEDRFRTLANITPAILWTAAPDGIVTWASDRWFDYTGIARADNPRNWSTALHPEDWERCLSAWNKAVQEGTPYEVEIRFRSRTGEYRWFLTRATPFRDPKGRVLGWCGSTTDIHNQKQMEESQRFLAEASKSLVSLVDYKSTLQIVAGLSVPAFADWCAVDMRNESGNLERVAVAHIHPPDVSNGEASPSGGPARLDLPINPLEVYHTGKPELVTEMSHWDRVPSLEGEGDRRLFQGLKPRSCICVPLLVKGRSLGTITFVTTASARQYGSSELALAEDLAHRATIAIENARLYQEVQEGHRRKDEFLAMLAHELRNPLVPIQSGLDILSMSEPSDPETIRVMQDQVEHVVRLVDDLLDVSRIIRNKIELRKEPVNLATLMHRSAEAARPHIDSRNQDLAISTPETPVWIHADPVRMIQVIENLLNNSSKYSDEGSRIELSAEVQSGQVAISVRDYGIGIEPELLPAVFELFTQSDRSLDRAQGGLGIGLTLVHQLVHRHGGVVTVHSDGPGKGSTFTVQLPVAEAPSLTESAPEHAARPQSLSIVVVDDNVGAAMLLAKLLGMLGDHQVITAHDGISALEAIQKHHPDVVLLDIGLPGMNGFQVAKAVREQPELNDVLLIALTGYGQKEDRMRSREAGFDEHRIKPPSIDQMREILRHPKLKNSRRQTAGHAASVGKTRRPARSAQHARSAANHELDDLTDFAPDELSKFRHDLGNVAHVLSMISELYLQPNIDPEMVHQAKKAVDIEVATLKSLIEKLRQGFSTEKA